MIDATNNVFKISHEQRYFWAKKNNEVLIYPYVEVV